MNISYDPEADAAYIRIGKKIGAGEASNQVSLNDTPNGESQVNLDFNSQGQLLGLEILVASQALSAEVLSSADPA